MLRPRLKIWLESEKGQVALSDWRVELLVAIERHGSLAQAARQLGVPYKTAWYKLKEMEATLGVQLLLTTSGGAGHGSTRLTEAAREAVQRYATVTEGVEKEVRERFESAFKTPLA
jgi:molybdate transport system regulatory protein